MEEKLKTISPIISQLILRNLGIYGSSYLGNDLYFLLEAVNILVSDVGESWLKKKYEEDGKNWEEVKKKLGTLNKLATKTKIFYDGIIDKKFEKMDVGKVQSMFISQFKKNSRKIALLQRELYDLFIFLVKNTTIKNATIPTEAFRIIEHRQVGVRDLTRQRPIQPSQEIR